MDLALSFLVFSAVGPTELVMLLTIILLLFGAKKIPELARGLGTGVREFRRGTSDEDDRDGMKERKEDKELPRGEALQDGRYVLRTPAPCKPNRSNESSQRLATSSAVELVWIGTRPVWRS